MQRSRHLSWNGRSTLTISKQSLPFFPIPHSLEASQPTTDANPIIHPLKFTSKMQSHSHWSRIRKQHIANSSKSVIRRSQAWLYFYRNASILKFFGTCDKIGNDDPLKFKRVCFSAWIWWFLVKYGEDPGMRKWEKVNDERRMEKPISRGYVRQWARCEEISPELLIDWTKCWSWQIWILEHLQG